jgi:hypothetical protein
MKKPISVCTTGLGHPEGSYELDDGRVIYANTYASAIGVWDGDWASETKPHPGRIVVVEKNGKAHILEQLDQVYPNGIVAEPTALSSGSSRTP